MTSSSTLFVCPPPQAYFEPVNWHRTALHELGHLERGGQPARPRHVRQPRHEELCQGGAGGRDDGGLHLRDTRHRADGAPCRLHRRVARRLARGRPRHRARSERRVQGGRLPARVPAECRGRGAYPCHGPRRTRDGHPARSGRGCGPSRASSRCSAATRAGTPAPSSSRHPRSRRPANARSRRRMRHRPGARSTPAARPGSMRSPRATTSIPGCHQGPPIAVPLAFAEHGDTPDPAQTRWWACSAGRPGWAEVSKVPSAKPVEN